VVFPTIGFLFMSLLVLFLSRAVTLKDLVSLESMEDMLLCVVVDLCSGFMKHKTEVPTFVLNLIDRLEAFPNSIIFYVLSTYKC